MTGIGKLIIFAGFILIIVGLLVYFSDRIPFLGRLPGDILVKKNNFTFYFPFATSIIISIIVSIILYFISKSR
ncbi:MAG: DUF2905 domain-containing protein [Bacteroidota bacterium]|nr:DUF2905 domain-containing protein [Bacteroidota bacterium]